MRGRCAKVEGVHEWKVCKSGVEGMHEWKVCTNGRDA